jgi:PAS domain S-box-containing protein
MRWSINSLGARLLIGSAIPLVLFLAVGMVVAVMIGRLLSALSVEKHTLVVIRQGQRLERDLDDLRYSLETVARPSAVAHHPRFRSGTAAFRRTAGELLDLVGDNASQHARLEQALAGLDRLRGLVESDGAGLSDQAGRQLAELQTIVRDFIAHEEELLEHRHARVEAETRQSMPVIGVTAAVALVLTVLLALAAARSVTRPVARLREAADQLLAGRYRSITPEGPTELADLVVLFNHMALTLTRRATLLERQEERYRTYIGSLSHILWTTDATGRVIADLPSWRAYTGQAEEEVQGLGWLDPVHLDDREAAVRAWRSAVEKREVFDLEFRLRSGCGEYRPFHCRGVPIINPDGSVREWIGTCTDITEATQRAALEQARDTAESASRAKSEFLTRMSHELRTPLNAVIGMSRMLQTQRFGPLTAKQADYLGDISRAGEHLLALINDILDLSKVEAGKMDVSPDHFQAAEAVEGLASTLRPLATAKGLHMELKPPAEDGPLETDPARFRQVLYNLLSNAIKFTSAGGVNVAWEWVAGAQLDAEALPQDAATAIRVTVRDTGIGIAPEDQKVIWEEFRQLRPAQPGDQPGTGLGLALTRRLVTLLGGTIILVSQVGQGSTFTFVLPRRLPERPCVNGEELPSNHPPIALVVEDHPPTCKLLCDWLAGAGLTAVPASDGEEGLVAARRLAPALIVLDVCLPRLDGWQVLTALKGDPATADIPVVVVSVDEQQRPSGNLAVQDFFIKPVERESFLRRLRERLPGLFRAGRPPRVLVVDDDPTARKLLGDLLRAEGAEVHEAADGRQALEDIRALQPDVVLLDLIMPEVDGFDVIAQVRGACELAGLPIVVVTAGDLDSHDRQRLQGRIQALLEKSVLTPERLREQLRALGVLPVPPATQPA